MIIAIFIVALLGLMLSCYALFIERKVLKDKSYKPVCDINDSVSCSKPILSPYGKLFFFSNALMGIIFYSFMMFLAWYGHPWFLLFASIGACLTSLIFAYILIVKIKSFCLICFAIYLVNALLLILSIKNI